VLRIHSCFLVVGKRLCVAALCGNNDDCEEVLIMQYLCIELASVQGLFFERPSLNLDSQLSVE
jgi:hypothetical protein